MKSGKVLFRVLGALLLLWLLKSPTQPGAHEEKLNVIIDTDMALDDARAIVLMLHSHRLRVMGIVTSDGSSTPGKGCEHLHRILKALHREDVPVAAGRALESPPPPWRDLSESLGYGHLPATDESGASSSERNPPCTESTADLTGPHELSRAASLILQRLAEIDEGITYVCIGPLTNLAEVLRRNPAVAKRIKAVFYFGTPPGSGEASWNTQRDLRAAELVFSMAVPLYALQVKDDDLLTFDSRLLHEIQGMDGAGAKVLSLLHRHDRVRELIRQNHMRAWDETVALVLDNPHLGDFETAAGSGNVFLLSKWDKEEARRGFLRLLSMSTPQGLESREPVVLAAYPISPSQFQEDLRPLVPRIIALHGAEEWKATVLTNELHRHLGIYSILGAKMGILAREILDASLDELAVESHAGLTPPLSCMNDGLQVATGASLGRGTIRVPDSPVPKVEALFRRGGKTLRLALKDQVKDSIHKDIERAIEAHGELSPAYFQEVRRLSFRYWAEMKREEIFEREFISP